MPNFMHFYIFQKFLTATNSAGIKVVTGLEIVEVEWEKDDKVKIELIKEIKKIKLTKTNKNSLIIGKTFQLPLKIE